MCFHNGLTDIQFLQKVSTYVLRISFVFLFYSGLINVLINI